MLFGHRHLAVKVIGRSFAGSVGIGHRSSLPWRRAAVSRGLLPATCCRSPLYKETLPWFRRLGHVKFGVERCPGVATTIWAKLLPGHEGR